MQPRVISYLHEEVFASVLVNQELHSPGIAVAHRLAELDGVIKHGLSQDRIQVEGGGDLDNLLVPSLD